MRFISCKLTHIYPIIAIFPKTIAIRMKKLLELLIILSASVPCSKSNNPDMKKFFLMVPAFLAFLSVAAQNQKLNLEAPLQILDSHQRNASPRYASDVSFTMMF